MCVKEDRWCMWRTYHISLSFSLFCIRERERERGVCFGAEEREKSAEK